MSLCLECFLLLHYTFKSIWHLYIELILDKKASNYVSNHAFMIKWNWPFLYSTRSYYIKVYYYYRGKSVYNVFLSSTPGQRFISWVLILQNRQRPGINQDYIQKKLGLSPHMYFKGAIHRQYCMMGSMLYTDENGTCRYPDIAHV